MMWCSSLRCATAARTSRTRLLCGAAAPARVIGDKWLSSRILQGATGFPSPRRWFGARRTSARRSCAEHGFPLVAKPRRGYASLDVYHRPQRPAGRSECWPATDYIVQEFLGDPAAGRRLPCDHRIRRHSAVSHVPGPQALDPGADRARRLDRPCDLHTQRPQSAPFEVGRARPRSRRRMKSVPHCARAFAAAGWRGPLNIQCEKTAERRDPHSRVQRPLHRRARSTGGFSASTKSVPPSRRSPAARLPPPRSAASAALEAFESLVARSADPATSRR